ncbi:type II toxin-antitoxin system VapC family toxin [Cyanothece sp. BG0011]|uniref:type II toxin-antitoxin system VapC family toxin n=1 Tax=Cyanothece sp. BG0011 TaxID=2082950 RepID=UPI000D1FBE43|nr:type II toxin-antitoxin system VapC family toxin [Cyanothece sp. BG0011]
MKLLLDTHAFLWFIAGSSKLSQNARVLIEDQSNERFLSIASLWEIAIKVSIGKLKLQLSISDLVRDQVYDNDIKLLGISPQHLDTLKQLDFNHKDPFDRLIIAQAITENLTILSVDSVFDNYPITRLW